MSANISWEVESALDTYERAVDQKVRREIDACCCQTSHDWDKAHEAEEAACEAREKLEQVILKELALTRKVCRNPYQFQ